MSKPDLILITGTPGSGKTMLARKLNEALYSYTHIDIDDILQSFWEKTKNPEKYDRETIGVPKAWKAIDDLLTAGVRLIVDVQIGEDQLKKLCDKYSLVNIHCRAEDTAKRFYKRELNNDGSEPDWLGSHMEKINSLEKTAKDPVDVGQKIIEVDCNNQYRPSLATIVKEIERKDI